MKHLLLVLLLVSLSSALADTPAKIAEDYRKAAAAALAKLNGTLEQATTPLISRLVVSGNTAGAEQLAAQLKAKLAGEGVPMPQASARLVFAQYDQARVKALEPVQKAGISRIESLLKSAEGGPKLETVTELGRLRAEIETGGFSGAAVPKGSRGPGSAAVDGAASARPAASPTGELVKKLGGTFTEASDGDRVDFTRTQLTASDLQQICADKRLISFSLNGGKSLTDEGLAAFEGLKHLDNLFLWSAGRFTDEGLRHLAGCENLRTLSIGANGDGITGTGFEALAQCKKLESLTIVFLTSVQGQNLRHLAGLPALSHLSMNACKEVTDADLDWVAKMTALKTLEMAKTSVTDSGLAKLAGLQHLQALTVSAPLVTPEGVLVLQKARPELKVIFAK